MPAAATSLLDAEFLARLERVAIAAKRVHLGRAKGERRSKRRGSSVEFADYRDYVQGDDLRFIDWNIFGRLEALYLKLFEEQEDLTVHLIIDLSASMGYGDPPKLNFACKAAAAIAYIALVNYDRVSIEAHSGGERYACPPGRGKAAAGRIFGFLESLNPGGQTRLETACRNHLIRSRQKGVAVLLSDFLDPDGFEGALRQLQMSGSDLYAIHTLAREELEPPIAGDLKLIDCEFRDETEISVSPALLKRYRQTVEGFCESLRQQCAKRRIGYVFAPSDMAFEDLSLEMLRRGGLLR